MAHAYTPGLTVTARTTQVVRRVLPIKGTVNVAVGDTVAARDVVAQTHMPGDVYPMNLANLMALPPADVPECLIKEKGDAVEEGDIVAQSKGIFGAFKKSVKASHTGTIETVSSITGQMIIRGVPIPIEVTAYVSGTVTEVFPEEGCTVETQATFIQGIFGIGGETCGPIAVACTTPDQELTPELITSEMAGAVVLGGARMSAAAIRKARDTGAAAIISGGIDDQDLKEFLGYDLGVAITGSEKMGITLVVTEGFGEISMAQRTHELLKARAGEEASVNGATQIRAGVMRPEIILPITETSKIPDEGGSEHEVGLLAPGRLVRMIRDPYFGVIGSVAGLPSEPAVLGSGSKARVLEVLLDSGESVVIPRANVELIED
jgi:hypothetical protein